jgi:hypothetical protein
MPSQLGRSLNQTSMKLYTFIAASILAALAAMPLRAQTTVTTSIDVPNFSFESPSSPTETSKNPNILSGWVFDVQGGSEYGTMTFHSANFSSPGAAAGNNYAFINNDYPGATDTLTSSASLATIAPLTTYTLTVAIGNRTGTGLYDDPGNVSFSLLANGVAFATQEVTNGTVPNGTFEDFTLTYETPKSASIIGENLTIQLATLPEQGTAFQTGFDNVTLDETTIEAAPEPATSILLVLGGISFIGFARLRRPNRVRLTTGLATFSFIMAGMASASADPVDVPNASFEMDQSGGGSTYSNPEIISDWIFNAPPGSPYGGLFLVFFNSPGSSSGSQCSFIENTSPGEEAFLTSAASLGAIAADTTYTLTVAVGNADLNNPNFAGGPFDLDPIADTPPGNVALTLLADGQPFATDFIPAGSVANGSWQDFSLSYTTTDCDPIVGEQLTIQLGTESDSLESEAASFDNVRLDASPSSSDSDGNGGGSDDGGSGPATTPEPPSWGLLGLGIAALGWLSRWQRSQT